MPVILASASPRRRDLLTAAGFDFVQRPADIDETRLDGEAADVYVRRLAETKARAVLQSGETVIGADTVVVIDGAVLGKPSSRDDAAAMLRRLSGRRHSVLTGVSVVTEAGCETAVEETTVFFTPLTSTEIDGYVAGGEPMDKAGSYGIQGYASKFVERIEGCYFNVVGLPVSRLSRMLGAVGC